MAAAGEVLRLAVAVALPMLRRRQSDGNRAVLGSASEIHDQAAGAMTLTEIAPDAGFTRVDENSAEIVGMMAGVLERLAALSAIQHVRRAARAAIGIRDGARVLDAGCGLGEEARELAGLAGPRGEVTGIDLSGALVAAARQRDNGSGVRYAIGDIRSLDFPDASFDAVRSERVIQHVTDPDAAVAELLRVTVPGGRVCLIDTDWESLLVDGVPAEYFAEIKRLLLDKGVTLAPAGRRLRGLLVRAGATAVTAEPFALPITDQAMAAVISPIFSRRALEMLNAPEDLTNSWFSALDEAIARDEFLAVLTMWVVTGTKPARARMA